VYSLVDRYRRFGEAFCFRIQYKRSIRPGDGTSTFLRKVGLLELKVDFSSARIFQNPVSVIMRFPLVCV
jgi:hypothetical protein